MDTHIANTILPLHEDESYAIHQKILVGNFGPFFYGIQVSLSINDVHNFLNLLQVEYFHGL